MDSVVPPFHMCDRHTYLSLIPTEEITLYANSLPNHPVRVYDCLSCFTFPQSFPCEPITPNIAASPFEISWPFQSPQPLLSLNSIQKSDIIDLFLFPYSRICWLSNL